MNSETLANIIESIVFVSGNAIAISDIAEKLGVTEKKILAEAEKLQKKYDEKSGLNLLIFNKKLQFCSNPVYADDVAVVLNPIKERELSRSMLEVAAIIAYKQPVTRLDLEQIRGVDSEYAIQNLLKLGVIEPVGRKDAIGRPVLFGTTDKFLKRFEISSLDELPDYESILESVKVDTGDDYLFKKDVYNADADNERATEVKKADENIVSADEIELEKSADAVIGENNSSIEQIEENTSDSLENAEKTDEDDDFELGEINDEEIPDFLKGEEVIKVD